MKTTMMRYNDDGALVPGLLIERFLRKPVFVSIDPGCGWERQTITKSNYNNLRPFAGPFLGELVAATNKHFDTIHLLIEEDE